MAHPHPHQLQAVYRVLHLWILGGGEIIDSGNAPDQGNNSGQKLTKTDANREAENADAAILGKAQKKAAARANRDSEEAARKRQEELAAAKRATDRSIWFRVCLYG